MRAAPSTGDAGLATRIGLAIVQPRRALAIAGDRRLAGRSGTDLILVILVFLAATQLRGLFAAGWLAVVADASLGLRAATQVLTRALTVNLGFLVLGALVLWASAGPRRNLGRAFDLACVAAIPLFAVELLASVVVRALDTDAPRAIGWVLAGIAWGWAGAVLALAWRPARGASVADAAPPTSHVRAGRVGWAAVALAVAGIAIQISWIARDPDSIRPISNGDAAPAFALPAIGPGGTLGARTSLAPGKIHVIDFWATWCGPCLRAMPKLEALARRHPDVAVLAVNLDDPAAARSLFDQGHYTMPLLADDGVASQRYGVSTIPHTVVIDRDGIIRVVARGGRVDLEAAVEQIRK